MSKNRQKIIDSIMSNAQKINELNNNQHAAAAKKASDPEAWRTACEMFQNQFDILAFPGGLKNGLELLKKQDATAIDLACAYLKADPYYFRSGYIKESLLRLLKNCPLNKSQLQEMQDIIIAQMNMPTRHQSAYARFAITCADDAFINRLITIAEESENKKVIDSVSLILKKLFSAGKIDKKRYSDFIHTHNLD